MKEVPRSEIAFDYDRMLLAQEVNACRSLHCATAGQD